MLRSHQRRRRCQRRQQNRNYGWLLHDWLLPKTERAFQRFFGSCLSHHTSQTHTIAAKLLISYAMNLHFPPSTPEIIVTVRSVVGSGTNVSK